MIRIAFIFCIFALSACGGAATPAATTADSGTTADNGMGSAMDSSGGDAAVTGATPKADAPAEDVANDAMTAAACTATSTVKSKTAAASASLCSPTALINGQTVSVKVLLVGATSGAPLTGLDLSVGFVQTSMGHSGSKVPAAREIGNGLYQIDGLAPRGMSGHWTLTVNFGKDSTAFHLNANEAHGQPMGASHAEATENRFLH